MTKKNRPRRKPDVLHTHKRADGSEATTRLTWEEAFRSEPPFVQAAYEHNYIHNQILLKESDRAVAVLAPAYLDALLQELLQDFFLDHESARALLMSDRALGTFSSRIDVVHALGFIPDRVRNDLHLVRQIRNDFAHRIDFHSLEEPQVRDRCFSLSLVQDYGNEVQSDGARFAFLLAIGRLVAEIANGLRYVRRRKLIPSIDKPGNDPNLA